MKQFTIIIHFTRNQPDLGQASEGNFRFVMRAPNIRVAQERAEANFDREYISKLTRTRTEAG